MERFAILDGEGDYVMAVTRDPSDPVLPISVETLNFADHDPGTADTWLTVDQARELHQELGKAIWMASGIYPR